MLYLILTTILFSCTNNINSDKQLANQDHTSPNRISSDTSNIDSSYINTGFYYLADKDQGRIMRKEHSDETYFISPKPFVSVQNILRANSQKNIVQGHETYGVTLVLDNQGTKDLENGTGNPSYPYIAIVMANRLIYVVENTSKIKTGIMQIVLVDYTESEVADMVNAVSQKR